MKTATLVALLAVTVVASPHGKRCPKNASVPAGPSAAIGGAAPAGAGAGDPSAAGGAAPTGTGSVDYSVAGGATVSAGGPAPAVTSGGTPNSSPTDATATASGTAIVSSIPSPAAGKQLLAAGNQLLAAGDQQYSPIDWTPNPSAAAAGDPPKQSGQQGGQQGGAQGGQGAANAGDHQYPDFIPLPLDKEPQYPGGYRNGTYANGQPRYYSYRSLQDSSKKVIEQWYERSALLPMSDQMITTNPTPADIDGSSPLARSALNYHNNFRAQFGAGALVWNTTNAQLAHAWGQRCEFKHELNDNLYMLGTSSGQPKLFIDRAVEAYAVEYHTYDFDHPGSEYSHFTQLVWVTHKQVGCSWSYCTPPNGPADSSLYFSCVYDDAGNLVMTNDPKGTEKFASDNVPRWINQNGMDITKKAND